MDGPGRFELFGLDTIDLAEHDASWLPYRVCGTDIEHRRSILTSFGEAFDLDAIIIAHSAGIETDGDG
ncbi:MAG: hypothetical protein HWE39_04530 [Oceanospirillaceae bacterium]|nr:hypothetical protein [Oceanospirillaceae bacterium]